MLRLLEWSASGDGGFATIDLADLDEIGTRASGGAFVWVDVVDASADEIAALARTFVLHPLVSEDLGQDGQRQKAELFGDQLLVVVHLPRVDKEGARIELVLDELDAVLGEHWLVTSHARLEGLSDATAAAIVARGDLRERGATAAMTGVLDRLVDRYEQLVDHLTAEVERQDRELLDDHEADPRPGLRRAAGVRHAVLRLRRSTGQLRELVGVLVRRELQAPGSSDDIDLELRDVYDHVIRAHDDLEILFERLAALADTRLAISSYRQNDITRRLSAWGAILLVPTVLTGWFGMNFAHLSLLGWPNGELVALGLIVALCTSLFIGFRRSGWI